MAGNKISTNKLYEFSNLNFKLLVIFCSLFLFSCSTTDKKPGDIDILRSQAETTLQKAKREAALGNFENAQYLLEEVRRNAILTDDLSLLVRTCMARGNVLLALGKTNDALAEWKLAVDNAERLNDPELLSVSKIYLSRGKLITENNNNAKTILDEVTLESKNIKKNRLYIAFSWQVIGLANRALEKYGDAEDAFKRSLDIHVKDSYLDNAAYDWYTIASIRSLSGNTQGAINALESSIVYDRRIENSWGIAASYRAMGDVYKKMGKQNEAKEAYKRARAIYAAIRNDVEVAEMDKRIGS